MDTPYVWDGSTWQPQAAPSRKEPMNTPEQELQETEQALMAIVAPVTSEEHARDLLARHASAAVAVALTESAKSLTPQASETYALQVSYPTVSAAQRAAHIVPASHPGVSFERRGKELVIWGTDERAVRRAADFAYEDFDAYAVRPPESLTPQTSPITEVILTFPSAKVAADVKRRYSRKGSDVTLLLAKDTVTLSGEDSEAVLYAAALVKREMGGLVVSTTPALPAESPKSLTPPASLDFRATVSLKDFREMSEIRAFYSGSESLRLLAASEGFQVWGASAEAVNAAVDEMASRWSVMSVFREWCDAPGFDEPPAAPGAPGASGAE